MNEMRLADFQILSRYFTMETPKGMMGGGKGTGEGERESEG